MPNSENDVRPVDSSENGVDARIKALESAVSNKKETLIAKLELEKVFSGGSITEGTFVNFAKAELFDLLTDFSDLKPQVLLKISNLIQELKAKFFEESSLNSKEEKSTETVKDNKFYLGEPNEIDVDRADDYGDFLRRIGCPERIFGEELEKYLSRLYPALLNRALIYFWNKSEDSGASQPRTKDYKLEPMYGPNIRVELLNARLIYLEKDTTEVYHFEAFFDQFDGLFLNPNDRLTVKEFTSRWKKLFAEMDVLHNRAVVRREGNNPNGPGYDPKGPDGALTGLGNLKDSIDLSRIFPNIAELKKIPEVEKEFLTACEFCMGVWSAMILKRQDRILLWPHISEEIKFFFDQPVMRGGVIVDVQVKKEFRNVLPIINGRTSTNQLKMIETMIKMSKKMLSSAPENMRENLAKLAYHVGESFRIGGGMDTFFDVGYKIKGGKSIAEVVAQDGEAKLASFGAYVESNNSKNYRTRYIDIYGERLFHLYVPVVLYLQYNHNLPYRLSEVNDGRASLLSLLAVKGGIYSIDWSTAVQVPDASVSKMASEAEKGYWGLSSVTSAIRNKERLMWDPTSSFKGKLLPFMRIRGISSMFDKDYWQSARRMEMIYKILGGDRYITADEAVPLAFSCTEQSGLTEEDAERIKSSILKDGVDYYMGTWKTAHPGDFIRIARFLFSRDDREEHNFFISERIQSLFGNFSSIEESDIGAASDDLYNRLAAYLLFEVNGAVAAWLTRPKYEESETAQTEGFDWKKLYIDLNNQSVDDMEIRSPSGRLMHTKEIEALVNRLLVIRDHPNFRDLMERYYNSGYRLIEGGHSTGSGQVFDRFDLLAFLQREASLAIGKKWKTLDETLSTGKKRRIFVLEDERPGAIALQAFIDKQLVIRALFGEKK